MKLFFVVKPMHMMWTLLGSQQEAVVQDLDTIAIYVILAVFSGSCARSLMGASPAVAPHQKVGMCC